MTNVAMENSYGTIHSKWIQMVISHQTISTGAAILPSVFRDTGIIRTCQHLMTAELLSHQDEPPRRSLGRSQKHTTSLNYWWKTQKTPHLRSLKYVRDEDPTLTYINNLSPYYSATSRTDFALMFHQQPAIFPCRKLVKYGEKHR